MPSLAQRDLLVLSDAVGGCSRTHGGSSDAKKVYLMLLDQSVIICPFIWCGWLMCDLLLTISFLCSAYPMWFSDIILHCIISDVVRSWCFIDAYSYLMSATMKGFVTISIFESLRLSRSCVRITLYIAKWHYSLI